LDLEENIGNMYSVKESTYCSYPDPGFCPGFSECPVFLAGMKIVMDKNPEHTILPLFFC
jgi:hypothetical protein